jgi:hypothetical protein
MTRELVASGLFSVQGPVASLGEAKLSSTTGELIVKPTNLLIETIYPAPEVGSVELTSAMRLLPEALQWTQVAVRTLDAGDLIRSDDAMLHVHSLLPELFCCRRLGEGFAAIMNAILSSFEGCGGVPMEKAQLEAVCRALVGIRSEPRMSFELALHFISAMEGAGLKVSPAGMDEIAEWLSE